MRFRATKAAAELEVPMCRPRAAMSCRTRKELQHRVNHEAGSGRLCRITVHCRRPLLPPTGGALTDLDIPRSRSGRALQAEGTAIALRCCVRRD